MDPLRPTGEISEMYRGTTTVFTPEGPHRGERERERRKGGGEGRGIRVIVHGMSLQCPPKVRVEEQKCQSLKNKIRSIKILFIKISLTRQLVPPICQPTHQPHLPAPPTSLICQPHPPASSASPTHQSHLPAPPTCTDAHYESAHNKHSRMDSKTLQDDCHAHHRIVEQQRVLPAHTHTHTQQMSDIRMPVIRTLQLTEHPKLNSSTCRLHDHTPTLVFYNTFSMVFSYLNFSIIQISLSPNVL